MKKLKITKNLLTDFLFMNVGTLMVSVALYFFKERNFIIFGGVGGLAIIINNYVEALSVGSIVSIFNAILLILGFIFLGKEMGFKTVYCTILFSASTWLFEYIFPNIPAPLTGNLLLDTFYAVLLTALGSALTFNVSATTGGTDIVSMIIKKYSSLDISVCLLISDLLITVCSGFVYGWKIASYSIFGLILQVTIVKLLIENLNIKKQVTIITTKPKEICDYINVHLNRGATVINGYGAYTNNERSIIYTVVNSAQAVIIKRKIKELDEASFVFITNTVDIIGNGFRQTAIDFADNTNQKNNIIDINNTTDKGEHNE